MKDAILVLGSADSINPATVSALKESGHPLIMADDDTQVRDHLSNPNLPLAAVVVELGTEEWVDIQTALSLTLEKRLMTAIVVLAPYPLLDQGRQLSRYADVSEYRSRADQLPNLICKAVNKRRVTLELAGINTAALAAA